LQLVCLFGVGFLRNWCSLGDLAFLSLGRQHSGSRRLFLSSVRARTLPTISPEPLSSTVLFDSRSGFSLGTLAAIRKTQTKTPSHLSAPQPLRSPQTPPSPRRRGPIRSSLLLPSSRTLEEIFPRVLFPWSFPVYLYSPNPRCACKPLLLIFNTPSP